MISHCVPHTGSYKDFPSGQSVIKKREYILFIACEKQGIHKVLPTDIDIMWILFKWLSNRMSPGSVKAYPTNHPHPSVPPPPPPLPGQKSR